LTSTSRSLLVASWAVGLLAFVFRLAAFNGFENDHFMHVAWAQQVLLGAWPGRDFAEPGMPLMVMSSAAAQWAFPGFLSEAMLGIILLAVAAGLVCTVTAAVTASRLAGVVAGLATMAWYPRFYSYPKLLVPAVTLWLLLRYARHQSVGRLWALAAGSVAAFLLRHDLGVMAALATVAGIAVQSGLPPPAPAPPAGRFIGAGLVLVAPYLLYLQMVEGIGEHIRVATEFGKAERHQFLWTASLEPESGGLAVSAGPRRVSPEGLLFWAYAALLLGGGALAVLNADPRARTVLAAWLAFAVLFRVVILRHPLSARLPDVAVVTSIGAVAAGYHALTWLLAWRRTRPMLALATAVLVVLVVVPVLQSSLMVVNLGDRLAQAGVRRGVGGVLRSARSVIRAWDGRSWEPYWPDGEEPPAVDYLRRCLSSTDRVLVTWFAPDYFVFSRKGFAAGHALFYPASFATDRDQAVMLDRLSRESVPIVLVNQSEHDAFARAFPRLADYVAAHYTVRTSFLHNDSAPIGVAFRNDLHPRSGFGTGAWACGFDAEPAGVLGHNRGFP
jgi:hypothetical protein